MNWQINYNKKSLACSLLLFDIRGFENFLNVTIN